MNQTKIKYLTLSLLWAAVFFSGAFAQGVQQDRAWGGANDIFDFPVGARAMAMGGAYVASADDPFALYWNPAALQNVQHMSLGVYYTNLPAGTQYSFLAYAHPTLFIGTFSIGVLSLSTPDIDIYDEFYPIKLGSLSYGRTLFLFGYGYRPAPWWSIGTTVKVERATLPGYPDASSGSVASLSESALGADAGLLLTPSSSAPLLKDLSFALNIQNLLQRSVRAVESRDSTPRMYRFGMGKKIGFGGGSSEIQLALEYDKTKTMPGQMRMGLEYGYENTIFLRTGFYGDQMTFGGGAKIAGVAFDYSYWTGSDALIAGSHRMSAVLNIGKGREQRLADYREREAQRIEAELAAKRREERSQAIVSGQSRARVLFARNDYTGAYAAISKVLFYDVTGNDPDLEDARKLQLQINAALEQQRRKEEAEILARNEEEMRIKRNNLLIEEHYQKALNAFSLEDFPEALIQCDQALAIDSTSERVQLLRKNADEQLRKKIRDLAERARQLQLQDRGYDAITLFNQARQLARGIPDIETFLAGQISTIESRLSREDLIRRAKSQEMNQNWAEAASLYREALRYDPGNQSLQERFREADARANAKEMVMPDNVREVYRKGVNAYGQHKYEEAVQHFEEARKLQPLNKTILKALDSARENLQRQTNTQGSQTRGR